VEVQSSKSNVKFALENPRSWVSSPFVKEEAKWQVFLDVVKNLSNNMKMLSLRCLHVSIDNVDDVLKVKLDLGQIMKFTYHLLVKSNVNWFDVDIISKMGAFMHGNVSWCGISHVEFIMEIASIGCLVKQETVHGVLQFDTKILLHKAQVSHTKLCHQLRLILGYSLFVIP
jgi:hypothetical protein